MPNRLTRNAATGSYVDGGKEKDQNLQTLCEMLGGTLTGSGEGEWPGSESTLTITDDRVTSSSKILIGPTYGTIARIGLDWRITTRSAGSFVITSDTEELDGCTFWYFVLNT